MAAVFASRSAFQRLALGCAGALLGSALVMVAIPVLAAARPVGVPNSLAPVAAEANAAAHSLVGAESRVEVSTLLQAGTRAWRAVSPSPTPVSARSEQASSPTSGGAYTPMTPVRLLNTRSTGPPLGPRDSLPLTVAGIDGVPADATAVALNVTVTNTTYASYLSVFPAGGTQHNVSNLNWTAGETVANAVIVPVGTAEQVTIYNYDGNTDVVVDLQGYFAPESGSSTAGAYVPLTPTRIADTRVGSGYPYEGDTLGPALSLPDTLNVQVTGEDGIPAGATGAIVNVTVVNTTTSSYLTAYPEGAPQPTASNLNWTAGETVANRVLVSLSSTGMITIYNYNGNTDVVVDVNGYFISGTSALPSNASLYTAITPARITDTRSGSRYPNEGDTLGAGGTLSVQVTGVGGIPADATAGVLNVTATDTMDGSYFTVYPTGGAMPTASDVNWTAGQTVPNLTVATLSSGGWVTVYSYAGKADLVVDAFGYFSPASMPGQLGTFPTSYFAPDFEGPISRTFSDQFIVDYASYIETRYPAGSSAPSSGDPGGAQAELQITAGPANEYTLSYELRFPVGFTWVKGGKLPGLCGGNCPTGSNNGPGGFAARFMWRADGAAEVLLSDATTTGDGTDLGRGTWDWLADGEFHPLTEQVTMNTPGVANGSIVVTYNGAQVGDFTGLTLAAAGDTEEINALMFSTFFGGNDSSWAPTSTQYIDFADFTVG
jgi:hypothetical protein